MSVEQAVITEVDRKKAKKITAIRQCLQRVPVDVEGLRRCSVTEFGFVNNDIRTSVWPILLDINQSKIINHESAIIEHKDTDQVTKDVERSMWRFTKGKSKLREKKRAELTRIINAILSLYPQLHYFQGYHEIGSILLMVTNERLSFAMLERLSLNHIGDSMRPSFSEVSKILNLLFPLLSFVDKQTHQFIVNSEVQPMFAISWLITWFAHNFEELEPTARLFDFFLASHPLIPLYFSLITYLKKDLLKLECAYDTVHHYFSNLPDDLPLDLLIQQTQKLYDKIPPKKLQERADIQLSIESPMTNYPFNWMISIHGKQQKRSHYRYYVLGLLVLGASFLFAYLNTSKAYGPYIGSLGISSQRFIHSLGNSGANWLSSIKKYIGY
ncbi:hypothetical protein SAMD00019534_059850 [Acytostelium subglobosum LB1]|uniref:hypothetical protein n=1 Tax=Acytostelium subglobosum LB1 TaxID=1410327 RepID=UPI000644DB45|nr:hypothetical protein SAMD00019534_059850 [Acytostelium subglobosum LB1]GAM22810.1 hypothetical protein SAMD00019534_059850 [Acytostelium subglobosum LB1]|eukprot:XP_012754037.1 hypothetical protein SAMD00019534_059850 [Acytostelium subglobosum LB1]